MAPGIGGIVGLAFALASGILLLILACALENNWWPLLALIIYFAAPLPNFLASRCCNGDDFMSPSSGSQDFGYFMTSFFVVSGIAFPIVLAHAYVISTQAMALSISGGVFVYGAIVAYIHFFGSDDSF